MNPRGTCVALVPDSAPYYQELPAVSEVLVAMITMEVQIPVEGDVSARNRISIFSPA